MLGTRRGHDGDKFRWTIKKCAVFSRFWPSKKNISPMGPLSILFDTCLSMKSFNDWLLPIFQWSFK